MPRVTGKNPNGVNQDAMRAVADVIEYNGARVEMGNWAVGCKTAELEDQTLATLPHLWDNCGTRGCIAAWTAAWADIPNEAISHQEPCYANGETITVLDSDKLMRLAGKELGLTEHQATTLFTQASFWFANGIPDRRNEERDPNYGRMVAALLRNIAFGIVELPRHPA